MRSIFVLKYSASVAVCFAIACLALACQGDLFDTDLDNDGVVNEEDENDESSTQCYDRDEDGCDDCTNGRPASQTNDGVPSGSLEYEVDYLGDFDADGICDAGDSDYDNDTINNFIDPQPYDSKYCGSHEIPLADNCDDCNLHPGTPSSDDDGADGNHDGICDQSDPNTPAQSICAVSASASQEVTPYNTAVNPFDVRHYYASELESFDADEYRDDCEQLHNDLVTYLNALPTGGCKNNTVVSANITTTFKVITSNGSTLPPYPDVHDTDTLCPTTEIANVPEEKCMGSASGCELATNVQGNSFAVDTNLSFAAAPSAGQPLETYPFAKTISFRSWVHGSDNTAKLVVSYKLPNGTVTEMFRITPHPSEGAADNASPTVLQIPHLYSYGAFVSGMGSFQFGHTNGPVAVKQIVISGREN